MGPNFPLTWKPDRNRWEVHYSLTHPASNGTEVLDWCWSTYGHPGTDPDSGVKSAWDYWGGWIYFYDKETVMLYNLRWS